MTATRAAKAALALVFLIVVALFVFNWYTDYRTAKEGKVVPESETTTESVNATGGASGETTAGTAVKSIGTVTILIDGLNFRTEPNKDAKLIRGLDKNEKLVLLRTEADWHHVQDASGVRGWISSNPQYTEIKK